MISEFIAAALLAIFFQNAILERALGINILLYASRQKSNIIGFTVVLCYINVLSSAIIWYIDRLLLGTKNYPILSPLIYIAVVGIIYIISIIIIWRRFYTLFRRIRQFVHLAVFNCAVLGALFLGSQAGESIFSYIGYGLGTALGFFAAGYLLYIAHERLNSELVPTAFRGMPIMVVYIGILSMALHAFVGYVI